MQALAKRHIKTGRKYDSYFDKAKFATINLPESDVFQTLEYMAELVRSTTDQTKRFAALFPNKNLNATCKGIFQFIYDHIQYKPDEQGTEQLRSPSRSWADRSTGVDCDCYSIIISSILTNLRIPHAFRMTKYDGKQNYQHVYVIVPKDGKTISKRSSYYVIDPVLDNFNQEKQFSQNHDKMMKIPHQVLNGPYDTPVNYSFGNEFNHLSGLGSVEEDFLTSTKSHLSNTLDQLNRNPKAFAISVDPQVFKAQLEYVLENWNDPVAREGALEEMAEMEELGENEPEMVLEETQSLSGPASSLIRRKRDAPISIRGARKKIELLRRRRRMQKRVVPATVERGTLKKDKEFKATCSCEMLNGLNGYFDGLGFLKRKKKKKGGFFKRVWSGVKNTAKKVGSGVKKAATKVGQVAKKVGKAIVRYNPLTVAARNALLLVMKLNLFGLAKKLKYGYMTESQARAKNMNMTEWRKIKDVISKMDGLFVKVGGKSENLRKAILTGKAGGINGLGEPITAAASTAAASGLIATITAWLKKINFKNLFSKAKNFVQQRRDSNRSTNNTSDNSSRDFSSDNDFSTNFNDDDIMLNQDLDEVVISAKRKEPDPPEKSNNGLMIGLAAAVGIGALLLMNKKKEEEQESLNGVIESIAL